jgi:hypothetical protein
MAPELERLRACQKSGIWTDLTDQSANRAEISRLHAEIHHLRTELDNRRSQPLPEEHQPSVHAPKSSDRPADKTHKKGGGGFTFTFSDGLNRAPVPRGRAHLVNSPGCNRAGCGDTLLLCTYWTCPDRYDGSTVPPTGKGFVLKDDNPHAGKRICNACKTQFADDFERFTRRHIYVPIKSPAPATEVLPELSAEVLIPAQPAPPADDQPPASEPVVLDAPVDIAALTAEAAVRTKLDELKASGAFDRKIAVNCRSRYNCYDKFTVVSTILHDGVIALSKHYCRYEPFCKHQTGLRISTFGKPLVDCINCYGSFDKQGDRHPLYDPPSWSFDPTGSRGCLSPRAHLRDMFHCALDRKTIEHAQAQRLVSLHFTDAGLPEPPTDCLLYDHYNTASAIVQALLDAMASAESDPESELFFKYDGPCHHGTYALLCDACRQCCTANSCATLHPTLPVTDACKASGILQHI